MAIFNRVIEKYLVPMASALNGQRHVAAVRDAFMLIFPLTISASMVILINNLIFSPDGFIAKILFLPHFFPHLADMQQYLAPVANGTINLISLFVAYLVANILAKHFQEDDTLAGLTSLACFMIIYPNPSIIDGKGPMMMDATYLGAQGIFVAMIIGCLVGEFLPKLFKNDKLKITMPDMVPPAVARSFSAMIPIVIVIMSCAIISALLMKVAPGGLNELIYSTIQIPLRKMGGNIFGILVIAFVQNLLWMAGIHGPNTLTAIKVAIFTEPDLANLAYVNDTGSTWNVPYPETFSMLSNPFSEMGGSGMTLGLLIAIFLVSKRADYREVAKMSFIPGLFNINEPVIFGLPIVLNPIMMVPFILTPMLNIMIGYLATTVFKIMPFPAIGVPWTIPGPLNPFLATGGNIVALIVGIVCLVLSIVIYIPFVIASNKVAESN